MNPEIMSASVKTKRATTLGDRRIVHRTAGHQHGGLTRLMSPGDLGELVKPFVFLDHFDVEGGSMPMLPMHPHSGISTHTTLLRGGLYYEDSTGKSGHLHEGSIEYMQAGGGVWHTGKPHDGQKIRGFQLWVALPPELELAPAESHYVDASTVPGDGRVRVLLGSFGSLKSTIPYPAPVTYLHVRLHDGESWSYLPAATHEVAWLAVSKGSLRVDGQSLEKEMAVFDEGNARIDVVADGETEFVIASAVQHPHHLVTGMYSVHTSSETLRRGEAGYRQIAASMRAAKRR